MMIEFDGGVHFNDKIYQCLMLNLNFLRMGAFCKTKLRIFRGQRLLSRFKGFVPF